MSSSTSARGRLIALALGVGVFAPVLTGCGAGGAPVASGSVAQPAAGASTAAAVTTAASTPAASASSASTPPSPSAATPVTGSVEQADGTTRYTDVEQGYQLTLPRGYVRITDSGDLAKLVAAGSQQVRSLIDPARFASLFASNVRFFAVDKVSGSTLNLLSTSSGGAVGADLPRNAGAFEAQLKLLKATHVTSAAVTIDGDQGLRMTANLAGASGAVVHEVQLVAVQGDRLFVVTVSGLSLSRSELALITRSLHFL